jgi:hypothetical protein
MNSSGKRMHAWELILKYYELKNGDRYNSTPARKLSQSFNLDIVGGTAISNKQVRLWEYEYVIFHPECLELWVFWAGFFPVILEHLAQNLLKHIESYKRKLVSALPSKLRYAGLGNIHYKTPSEKISKQPKNEVLALELLGRKFNFICSAT